MRQVEQIVDYQPVIAAHVETFSLRLPARIVEQMPIGDRCRVGQGPVAHPDPHEAPFLDNRVDADIRTGWNLGLTRHLDALPGTIERQSVITAFEGIFDETSFVERIAAMRAAIFEGNNRTVFLSKENHGLVYSKKLCVREGRREGERIVKI